MPDRVLVRTRARPEVGGCPREGVAPRAWWGQDREVVGLADASAFDRTLGGPACARPGHALESPPPSGAVAVVRPWPARGARGDGS